MEGIYSTGEVQSGRVKDVRPLLTVDQSMLLVKAQMRAACFYDMNGFVEDPQAEFDEYQERISWSDDEKRRFVGKISM
jgi:hypothetical protein